MIDLKGKVAIVTGASRGIGLETARVLAACGARVAIIATKENSDLALELSSTCGVEVKSYGCDVSNTEQVTATFKSIIETFGAVDILVNNAGITRDGLLMRMKDEDFDETDARTSEGDLGASAGVPLRVGGLLCLAAA